MKRAGAASPTAVGPLLTAVLPGLGERLLEARVRREWLEVMGPEIAGRSEPHALANGDLHVIVDNSPWLQELTLREGELRLRLTARYGAAAIRSLRFSLGSGRDRGEPSAFQKRPDETGELTEEEKAWVEEAAAQLTDPALAALARRVLVKDALARRTRGGGR